MAYGTDWHAHVKNLLKGEMKRRDIGYRELAERLGALGIDTTAFGVSNRLSRGAFSAVFLVQCLHAIGAQELRLDVGPNKTGVPARPAPRRGGYRRAAAPRAAERAPE